MNQKSSILIFIISILMLTSIRAQNPYDRTDMLKLIDSTLYKDFKNSYPITRDTLNQFPDSLAIEGVIIDYITGVSCGFYCGCGAIKIKLTNPNPKYKEEFIFIGIPCFNELPDSLKQRKNWTLSKIALKDNSCYWTEVPVNKFDSKGIPFYTTKD